MLADQAFPAAAVTPPQFAPDADAVRHMRQLYDARQFRQLEQAAGQCLAANPQQPQAARYLGIARFLQYRSGTEFLRRAEQQGDTEAALWLHVVNEFSLYPLQQLANEDFIGQVAFYQLRSSRYMDYPLEVTLETLAVCNAACHFCPYPSMQRRGERMADDMIGKILNDLTAVPADLPFTVAPFKVNDPFLDKRIFGVCQSINRTLPNAALRLFTNGSPLTADCIGKVAELRNVMHLWISLNETQQAKYEEVMQLPFARTVKNLDALHRCKAQGNFPHAVQLSRVADGSEADAEFKRYVAERYPLFRSFVMGRGNWTGQVAIAGPRIPVTGCQRWFELSVMAGGKVALCCQDGEGRHLVGDLAQQSVLQVYNSPGYRKLRQYTVSRMAAAAPCGECGY